MENRSKASMPTDVSVITTYRCQMRCKMCNIWKYPSNVKKEISPKDLEKLPKLKFANVTGGEPFQRRDLEDIIISIIYKGRTCSYLNLRLVL